MVVTGLGYLNVEVYGMVDRDRERFNPKPVPAQAGIPHPKPVPAKAGIQN